MKPKLKKQTGLAIAGLLAGTTAALLMANRHRLKVSRMGSFVGARLNDFLDQTRTWGIELIAILNEDADLLSSEVPGRRIYEDEFGARRTRGLTPRRSPDSSPFS